MNSTIFTLNFRCLSLEDGESKSKRLMQEGIILAESERLILILSTLKHSLFSFCTSIDMKIVINIYCYYTYQILGGY